MRTKFTAILLVLSATVLFGKPSTPAPGSPERKAICDAIREYVLAQTRKPIARSILFKIEFLKVDGNYAGFEGVPVNPDGSPVPDGLLGDAVFMTFLKKTNGDWRVVQDLTRSDVPSDEEMSQIRRKFPADIPSGVIPDFWRKLLRP